MRKMAHQLHSLSKDLPIQWASSIFVVQGQQKATMLRYVHIVHLEVSVYQWRHIGTVSGYKHSCSIYGMNAIFVQQQGIAVVAISMHMTLTWIPWYSVQLPEM